MELTAACSSAIRADVQAPDRPSDVLGVGAAALYLRTADTVVAVVTADAVRLPCALRLDTTSRELPLTRLLPAAGDKPVIGSDRISWASARGRVTLTIGSEWAPARPGAGQPRPDRIVALRSRLSGTDHGVAEQWLAALARQASEDAVSALLGAGAGLTPSGDDVLAGFVLAADAFGLDVDTVRALVHKLADERTTALSAQLLRHALRGECIPELAALIDAVAGVGELQPALDALLGVGHTSGAALAAGVAVAAVSPDR